MHGMFKANGGCGYVKKPEFLLKAGDDIEVFDPKAKLPVKTRLKVCALDYDPVHYLSGLRLSFHQLYSYD